MALSEAKIDMVARIFAAAPDVALHRLESLLLQARTADPSLDSVHTLATAEVDARRIVAAVFNPILAMTVAVAAPKRQILRRAQLAAVWAMVSAADPDLARRTTFAVRGFRGDDLAPLEFDEVCLRGAELASEDDDDLALILRLVPVLRTFQPRLASLVRNLSGENIAAVRLAFKDALAVDEDAGAAFWEAVFALLDEPWQVIRLISAAIDRPSDRYLASSELAGIGERLLADIDARIAALKRFDPSAGEAAGAAEAVSVMIAVQQMAEFEEWLALKKDGPWGARIVEQKRNLALCMEARLRETEPAVAAALPTQPMRGSGKSVRPAPKLVSDPQLLLVNRADALLTLMEEARGAAAAGGFGALRTKTLEALEKRLDQYCDDLVDLLHKGEQDEPERIRAYVEIAARFLGLVKGPQASQIVRRRAAAA